MFLYLGIALNNFANSSSTDVNNSIGGLNGQIQVVIYISVLVSVLVSVNLFFLVSVLVLRTFKYFFQFKIRIFWIPISFKKFWTKFAGALNVQHNNSIELI